MLPPIFSELFIIWYITAGFGYKTNWDKLLVLNTKLSEYLCNGWSRTCSLVVITMWSFPQSLFITGFVIRVTRRVPHVEQKLLNLPEHLIAPAVFSIDHVARFLVYCAMFCRSLSVCLCSFVHCLVFSSLIYSLWLLLSYLQTFFYRRGEIKIWPFVINRIFILYYID